jgi:TonB family protein
MIGTEIANYKITDLLGEGGMGVVYKAIDLNLDRPVAIKVLNSELARNPELVERFRAEARAQANLNHTNLATLYSFLVYQGSAMMVMEYVDGETLAKMSQRRGPIPSQEIVPLFKQALLGVGYAHRMGIIHRDIKPSNLMVNKNGIVKVMDFGIAKVIGNRGMTRTGAQMGTAYYMSPEQVMAKPVDIRSDIYSLGITLYEMLSGHVPFDAESDYRIMADHVNTPPQAPSRFYPYIPKGVENAVLQAIAKDPDQRFQKVEEFGAALEHPDDYVSPYQLAVAAPSVPPGRTVLEGFAPALSDGVATATGLTPSGAATPAGAAVQPAAVVTSAVPAAATPAPPNTHAAPGTFPAATPAPVPAPRGRFGAKAALLAAGALAAVIAAIVLVNAFGHKPLPPGPSGGGSGAAATGPQTAADSGSGHLNVIPTAADTGGGSAASPGAAGGTASGTTSTSSHKGDLLSVPFNQLRLLRRTLPAYPQSALSAGITGPVTLKVWINSSGAVDHSEAVAGNPVLVQPAQDAVQGWQFAPYTQDGQATAVVTLVPVSFEAAQAPATQTPAGGNAQQAAVQQALTNGYAAMREGRLVVPDGNNAVYFARQAKQIDPTNAQAAQIEHVALLVGVQTTQSLVRSGRLQDAQIMYQGLASYFPNQPQVAALAQQIQSAQAPAQAPVPPLQQHALQTPPAGGAPGTRFVVIHAHGNVEVFSLNNISYCWGVLSIDPSGAVRYDCTGTKDRRCDHINFTEAGVTELDTKTNRVGLYLHFKAGGKNWNFYSQYPQMLSGACRAASAALKVGTCQ